MIALLARASHLFLVICLVCCASVSAAVAGEETGAQADERFMRVYYYPLEDPDSGRLYRVALELLNAERDFSRQWDLSGALGAGSPAQAEADAGEADEPEADDTGEQERRPDRWVTVLERPIVPQEEMAYAEFRAGHYEEAAGIYQQLHERAPQDAHVHVLMMLVLATKNAGDPQKAKELLAAVGPEETEARGWADWMIEMMNLSLVDRREEK